MASKKFHVFAAQYKTIFTLRQLTCRRQMLFNDLINTRCIWFKHSQCYSSSQYDDETEYVPTATPSSSSRNEGVDRDWFGVEEHHRNQLKRKEEELQNTHAADRPVFSRFEAGDKHFSHPSYPWNESHSKEPSVSIDFFNLKHKQVISKVHDDKVSARFLIKSAAVKANGTKSNLTVNCKVNKASSLIDEQYFGNEANQSFISSKHVSDDKTRLKYQTTSDHSTIHSKMQQMPAEQETAYIDDQYFVEHLKDSQLGCNIRNGNEFLSTDSEDNGNKVSNAVNDLQSLSTIDKQYFGDYNSTPAVLESVDTDTDGTIPPARTFQRQNKKLHNSENMVNKDENKSAFHTKSKKIMPYNNVDTDSVNYGAKAVHVGVGEYNIGQQLSQKTSRITNKHKLKDNQFADNFSAFGPPSNNRSNVSDPKPSEPETAYEVAMSVRSKSKSNIYGEEKPSQRDSKGFRILKDQVPNFTNVLTNDVLTLMRKNILYNDNDIVALNKPYGLPSVETKGSHVSISQILDKLLPSSDPLHMVQWLDRDVTGIILLAKTRTMQRQLKEMLKTRGAVKYWAIVKNKPKLQEGVIDIPLKEVCISGKYRMGIAPYYTPDMKGVVKKMEGEPAQTKFRILSEQLNCCLLECIPLTNVQHQIRTHLSFGINCTILGDHKYSHTDTLAPQRLHGDMLRLLRIQQTKVRHLPLHLHLRSVFIEDLFDYGYFHVASPLPVHFLSNASSLKLNFPHSKHAYRL